MGVLSMCVQIIATAQKENKSLCINSKILFYFLVSVL